MWSVATGRRGSKALLSPSIESIAEPVDFVIGEALVLLKAYVETDT